MSSQQRILEVNSILTRDYNAHNYNQQWISQNIPSPKIGNRYESLRQDAPFYCSSSLGVMINYYQTKPDFTEFVYDISGKLLNTEFPSADLNELLRWILFQTNDCIMQERSDRTDLQNVGWWMGRAVYVACIVSNNYRAQYEKLFIESWKMYFTNENLATTLDKNNSTQKDYFILIEDYIKALDIPFEKQELENGDIFYSFNDFNSGIVNIRLSHHNNKLKGFSIRGLHNEMHNIAKKADQTNLIFDIPILQYYFMDEEKMTPQIIAIIKN